MFRLQLQVMTSIGSEKGTLPALQKAAYSKNNTPVEDEHDAFLRALPQLVKLRIPCPCSKPGLVSLQKRNLLKDPQELINRSCKVSRDRDPDRIQNSTRIHYNYN